MLCSVFWSQPWREEVNVSPTWLKEKQSKTPQTQKPTATAPSSSPPPNPTSKPNQNRFLVLSLPFSITELWEMFWEECAARQNYISSSQGFREACWFAKARYWQEHLCWCKWNVSGHLHVGEDRAGKKQPTDNLLEADCSLNINSDGVQKCLATPGRSPSVSGMKCKGAAVVPAASVVCEDASELFLVRHGLGNFNWDVFEGGWGWGTWLCFRNGSITPVFSCCKVTSPQLELRQACCPGSGQTSACWLQEDGAVLDFNCASFWAGAGSSQSPTEEAEAWGKAPLEWLSKWKRSQASSTFRYQLLWSWTLLRILWKILFGCIPTSWSSFFPPSPLPPL